MNIPFILRKNLMLKHNSILEAIKRLNDIKFKTLIIIDNHKKICGTLTDGDIRRGLLKGYNVNSSVDLVLNKHPVINLIGRKKTQKVNYKNHDIIPSVDKYGKIKKIEIANSVKFPSTYEHTLEIVLMAGGFGKRLMPLTRNTPKPLLKIKNKSILEMAMENFKKYGFKIFNISTYYKSCIVKKYFKKKIFSSFKIVYLEEKKPLGTAGCLSLLNYKNVKDNILVFNGDVITDLNIINLIKFHQDTKSDITVCAKQYSNSSLYGEICFKGHKINEIIEKPKKQNFINAGIYLIKKKMIKNMRVKYIDMPNFIDNKIKRGCSVNIYPIYEYWAEIGSKDIFKKLINKK